MSVIKILLGFRACNFQLVSLASGRAVFSYCGADPSKSKKRLSSPILTTSSIGLVPVPAVARRSALGAVAAVVAAAVVCCAVCSCGLGFGSSELAPCACSWCLVLRQRFGMCSVVSNPLGGSVNGLLHSAAAAAARSVQFAVPTGPGLVQEGHG
jgi:hypothetical protein